MPVDVHWEGIELARDVTVRLRPGGFFVPLPMPMPVGTRLLVRRAGEAGPQEARVMRVDESHEPEGEPGVYLMAEGELVFSLVEPSETPKRAEAVPVAGNGEPTRREEAEPVQAASDVSVEQEDAAETSEQAAEPASTEDKGEDKGGKGRRRRRR